MAAVYVIEFRRRDLPLPAGVAVINTAEQFLYAHGVMSSIVTTSGSLG